MWKVFGVHRYIEQIRKRMKSSYSSQIWSEIREKGEISETGHVQSKVDGGGERAELICYYFRLSHTYLKVIDTVKKKDDHH